MNILIQMRIPVLLNIKEDPVFKTLLLTCEYVRVFAGKSSYRNVAGEGVQIMASGYFLIYIYLFSLEANYFAILYWFCHTLTWICHGCTCVPHPEPSSHLPPHLITLGHPSAPAPSTLYHTSNLDWWFIWHMIIYIFQCHSPKPSHPCSLPQSPKDWSIHMCLFCCLAYRVIIHCSTVYNSQDMEAT